MGRHSRPISPIQQLDTVIPNGAERNEESLYIIILQNFVFLAYFEDHFMNVELI